jgi:hypothetical protein
MAIGDHAFPSETYSTSSIASNTNVRDVSNMLDFWAHTRTPVLNRIQWGEESGGLVAEWVSEHLGWGYVQNSAALASASVVFVIKSLGTGFLQTTEQMKQVQAGTMLYFLGTGSARNLWVITSVASSGTTTCSILTGTSDSVTAATSMYIVGHFANEGSVSFGDTSRQRTLLSNKFAILRKDVKITGSQAATDMYAVGRDDGAYQTSRRLIELQIEREWAVLYSSGQARTSTIASYMYGAYGYLNPLSAQDWVDTSTTTLKESDVNDMVATIWDNGAEGPLMLDCAQSQIRKFTQWDQDRVRTVPDSRLAGHYITRYLTDVGIEIELIPLRQRPTNLLFLLDASNMKLRAKRGRKLIMRKDPPSTNDYDMYALISEYTLEMRGYERGLHAMWAALT